jgi:hypothetical protein
MLRCSSKTMTKEEMFALWAPDESPWSRWAKPVLFAFVDSAMAELPLPESGPDVSWCPAPDGTRMLVLDLPGPEAVLAGVELARRGYRPVPLYNAVPLPFGVPPTHLSTGKSVAAVNVLPIVCALRKGAETLATLALPANAPPAFLLDANRAGDGRKMQPEDFDNRSVSFTSDFPSANFFSAHAIDRVTLVQKSRTEPLPDLAHSLRRWQEAGFALTRKRVDSPEPPEIFNVPRPAWYGLMFQRVLASLGLRRSSVGGFGAWVPDVAAGG